MDESTDGGITRRRFIRGTAGAAAAGAATGTAAAAEGGGSSGPKTVEVGPGNQLVFKPEKVYVKPGQTVKWVWKSNNHNIVPGEIPSGASWEGTAGPPTKTYNEGHTYTHTFEKTGTYNYWCQPHKSAGMIGDVVVNQSGQPPGGGFESVLPDAARTAGVAATGGMISVLGLAYFFLKYGGGYTEE